MTSQSTSRSIQGTLRVGRFGGLTKTSTRTSKPSANAPILKCSRQTESVSGGRAKGYAVAIQVLRRRKGLEQGEIPGLSARHIRPSNREKAIRTPRHWDKLASAHDLLPAEYVRPLGALASVAEQARGSE
jgi:hypothetical protein